MRKGIKRAKESEAPAKEAKCRPKPTKTPQMKGASKPSETRSRDATHSTTPRPGVLK